MGIRAGVRRFWAGGVEPIDLSMCAQKDQLPLRRSFERLRATCVAAYHNTFVAERPGYPQPQHRQAVPSGSP